MLCFIIHQCVLPAWVVTSCLILLHAGANTRRMGLPFQVCTPYIVYLLDLLFTVRCAGVFSEGSRALRVGRMGKHVAQTLSTCRLHAGALPPSQLRWLLMANAVSAPMCTSPQSSKNHMETFLF